MTTNPRARRPKGRRPLRQGDLDGLCGVYCIVNAVRTLCPEVDRDTAEYLFALLMQKLLSTASNPSMAVTWGIGRLALMSLVEEAINYVLDDFDIRLTMKRLPKGLRQNAGRDELWAYLEKAVSPECVAILGLGGKYAHWSVAVQMTATSAKLVDSGEMRYLSRKRCTVRRTLKRCQIPPVHVLLIRRVP